MKIFEQFSPNYEPHRRGKVPLAFVIHVSEGSFQSTSDWMSRTESKVSYHFLVKDNGEVCKLVDPRHIAFHAGVLKDPTPYGEQYAPDPNAITIGIAYAGFAATGPTADQICSIAHLINQYAEIYTIPIDRRHIIAHHDIRTDKVCPGAKVDFEAIIYLAQLHRAPSLT